MTDQTTRVLYITGTGRSGSTVLANILGQVDGLFAAGELRYLWERGMVQDRLCGCGERFSACPVWQEVLQRGFGGPQGVDPQAMLAAQRAGGRVRHLPVMMAARHRPERLTRRLGEYPDALARLYRAVGEVSGARLIVDSSKLPAYGFVLQTVPSIELFVVHLVRDPRAAAYSWLRRKVQPDRGTPGFMEEQGPVHSSVLWDVWNMSAETFWRGRPDRYLRLRYEDFVARPREAVERILAMVGIAGAPLPFVDDRTVLLGVNHSVAGNPNRLEHGRTRLRPDTEWVERIRPRDRALVTAVTAPLLHHFGYALRPPAPAQDGGEAAA